MAAPEKLYIYEIAGRINPPAVLTGEDFLGCWREGDCSYWFFTAKKQEPVSAWLKEEGRAGGYLSETEMNFADWEAGQPLKPTRVGGFYLCPIWETPEAAPGEILIRLEPGLAFGSGYHPTTRLCLELLRRVYEEDTPEQVLDLGTGSGILTLACLALGSRRVVAVEHNDLAVRTAQRNFRHNRREQEIFLINGDARHFTYLQANLVLANIHLDVLLDLAASSELFDKKWQIYSGLLGTQVDRFLAVLKERPVEVLEVLDENLWFAVLARRRE